MKLFSFWHIIFFNWKYPGIVIIASNIPKSLKYTKKKLVKIVSSDKRQNHIWYTFSSCLVITDFKMIPKVVCLLIFLKIWISNLIFSDERYIFDEKCTFSTFRWVSIISAKVNHSIIKILISISHFINHYIFFDFFECKKVKINLLAMQITFFLILLLKHYFVKRWIFGAERCTWRMFCAEIVESIFTSFHIFNYLR